MSDAPLAAFSVPCVPNLPSPSLHTAQLHHLQVSNEGEVCYVFDPGFVGKIRNRSWVQRLLPWWNRAKSAALYATRIAFGTALVVSVVLVWLAVAVLASSGRDNDNR